METMMTTLNGLQLTKGSAVMQNQSKGFVPVLSDLGTSVLCYDAKTESEFKINKSELSALYLNGDIAFLPKELSLNAKFDFNRLHGSQKRWLSKLNGDDMRQLIAVVALFYREESFISNFIDLIIQGKHESIDFTKVSFSHYEENYIGQYNSLSAITTYNSNEWQINFFGSHQIWTSEQMFNVFRELVLLAIFRPLEELTDIQLMAYYRIKGYILKFQPEYDIWTLNKCFSSKKLSFNSTFNLHNFEQVIKQYNEFAYKGDFIDPQLSPNNNHILQEPLKAFIIPKGSLVIHKQNSYYVHGDLGRTIVLQAISDEYKKDFSNYEKLNDFLLGEPFEIPRKMISAVCFQVEDSNVYYSLRFVPFGINANTDGTREALNQQEAEYYKRYSDLELAQSLCLYLLAKTNDVQRNRFLQAYDELDLSAAINILDELHKKEFSGKVIKVSDNNVTYTPSKEVKVKFKFETVAVTMFNMLYNVKNLKVTELNIPELQLYWSFLGDYKLEVYPNNFMVIRSVVSDKYIAFHSHKKSPYDIEKFIDQLNKD